MTGEIKAYMNRFYRAYSLTCPAAMQIYWNKRKCLYKKTAELPQDWFGTPTGLLFYWFATPIWLPYFVITGAYALYLTLACCLLFYCQNSLLLRKQKFWHSHFSLTKYFEPITFLLHLCKHPNWINCDIELALIFTEISRNLHSI